MKIHIEVLHKLKPSLLVAIAKHSQRSLQYMKKEGRDEVRFFYMQINIKLSCKVMLLSSVGMASHTQINQNNKFTKSLQYLKNDHVCWLSCVMGIISFICQSKTITNDYFHLKNEGGDQGSSSNVLLLFIPLHLLSNFVRIHCWSTLTSSFKSFIVSCCSLISRLSVSVIAEGLFRYGTSTLRYM